MNGSRFVAVIMMTIIRVVEKQKEIIDLLCPNISFC